MSECSKVNSDEDLKDLQQRLHCYWQRGNPLEFDLPKETPEPDDESESPLEDVKKKPAEDNVTSRDAGNSASIRLERRKATAFQD